MSIFLLRDGPADRSSFRDSGYQTPSNGTLLHEIKCPNNGTLPYADNCSNYGTLPYDSECPNDGKLPYDDTCPNYGTRQNDGKLPFGSKFMVRQSVAATENSADAGSNHPPSTDSPPSCTSRPNCSLTSSSSCSVDEDGTNSPDQSINSDHGHTQPQIDSSGKRRVSLLRTERVDSPALNSPPIRRRRFGLDNMEAILDVQSKARNSNLFFCALQLFVSLFNLWSLRVRNSVYFWHRYFVCTFLFYSSNQ